MAVRKVFLLIEAESYGRRDFIFYASAGNIRRYPFLFVCRTRGELIQIIYGGYRWS